MKYSVFLYTALAVLAVSCVQSNPDAQPAEAEAPVSSAQESRESGAGAAPQEAQEAPAAETQAQ